eukprot:gene28517-43681_t
MLCFQPAIAGAEGRERATANYSSCSGEGMRGGVLSASRCERGCGPRPLNKTRAGSGVKGEGAGAGAAPHSLCHGGSGPPAWTVVHVRAAGGHRTPAPRFIVFNFRARVEIPTPVRAM